jgi:hypothetical protein
MFLIPSRVDILLTRITNVANAAGKLFEAVSSQEERAEQAGVVPLPPTCTVFRLGRRREE